MFDRRAVAPKQISEVIPTAVSDKWLRRETQIVPIEMIAPILAIQTFRDHLRNKDVLLLIDSEAVEAALVKGYSSKEDLCELVEIFWELALECAPKPRFAQRCSSSKAQPAGSEESRPILHPSPASVCSRRPSAASEACDRTCCSHGSHHGYHQLYGTENLHGNLLFKLLQPGGSLQNLCLVPLLIVMNLLVALLMQCIARRTRIQAAGPRNEQKPEERYSAVAAFLRDFAGIQSVYNIAKGWLTHDAYRCVSTSLCLLTIAHWFLREWTYAQLLSSLTADLTNAIVAVRSTRDLSLVYSRLFSMLAWQIATAPLFLILDPMIQAWFASSLQSYITNSMLQSYVAGGGQAYYKLKMDDEKRDLDNPDQRISESAEQFAFLMYVLFSGFLSAVFGMLAWAGAWGSGTRERPCKPLQLIRS
eukprot:s9583_g1.t1